MNTQNQDPTLQGLVMKAPVSTSDFEKKDKSDIEKIAVGNHLGRLYGIVDLGEQLNTVFNKRSHRIALLFEFPHLMQDFYKRKEGEPQEFKPTMIKLEETYSMHPKSNFRKIVESAVGRRFTETEAAEFNVFGLLGNWFTCNVMHDPDKKNANNVYERINFLQPYDERFKVAGVDYSGINKLMAYSIQLHKFSGPNWQGLWNKFRTQIQGSSEGQAHANNGGTFEEVKFDDNGNIVNNNSGYQGPASPQSNPMGGGQPQAQPSAPASTPAAPSTPNAPQTQRKLVITTPPLDLAAWTNNSWTEQMMVEQGHAHYVDSPI